MARSQRGEGTATGAATQNAEDKGQPQMLSNNPIPNVDESQMRSAAVEVGDATTIGADKPSPPVKKYRVISQDKHARSNDHRALMRYGKIVSEQQYNIKELRAQGVQLEELQPGEAG